MTTADKKQSSELRERIKHALNSQKQPTITVLSSLLAVQDSFHYLPAEAMRETAVFCGSTVNETWSVASFYTNFRFTPPGENTLDVCWGPSCHLLGAQDVLYAVQQALEIDGEGESKDGKITLKYNTCLGACSQPPVLSIDHRVKGRLTPESARRIVAGLVNGGSV